MSEHYFSPQADTDPDDLGKLHPVRVNARGRELKLLASDRVFSATHLDLGTEQLLKKAPALPASGTFLDLGCGWGPVAITMALEAPDATVWGVDVNAKALALTKLNAKKQGLKNVLALDAPTALQDARDNKVRFDVIWSNPPIRIGKPGLRALLTDWLNLLAEDGVAYLVVNRHLGADSLADWLRGQGFEVERLASRKGFRILSVTVS
ncbi:class I SAM-dependent methyltransferase [Actinomyces minihominis]|uniref:class I SAM-dependent methyltransferase n=1 Tax=Actinomyces minihominis TaxID=2002838 RepID=UPI000C086AB5|nr:methyltransferase [Actinomyces minihominis]